MRFRNREERERYMDSLEQQMEHQREQIQRTLDQTKGSGRLRRALEKRWGTLPSFPAAPPPGTVGKMAQPRGHRTARLRGAGGRSGGSPGPVPQASTP